MTKTAEEHAAEDQKITDALPERAKKAVGFCRKGKYAEALVELEAVLADYKDTGKLPARLLSYYGVCLAEVKNKVSDGLECCRIAISRDRFHADHYANIARIYIIGRSRKKAVEALKAAQSFDVDNTLAGVLWTEIGRRKSPVLSFLPRDHKLNVLLGKFKRKKP
jgi:hypothetical protein